MTQNPGNPRNIPAAGTGAGPLPAASSVKPGGTGTASGLARPAPVATNKPKSSVPANQVRVDFSPVDSNKLLSYARGVIEATVCGEPVPVPLSPALADANAFGLFVTILRATIRSCKGQLSPKDGKLGPLLLAVGREAAVNDMRFPSIHESELPYLSFELSLMHNATVLAASGEARAESVKVGQHGLIMQHPRGRALLLPGVAIDNRWKPQAFLDQLCGMAGLPVGAWKEDEATITTFETRNLKDEPAAHELTARSLSPEMLQALVDLANSQLRGGVGSDTKFPLLHRRYEHDLGVQVFTSSGVSGLAVSQGHHLADLTRNATRMLAAQFSLRKSLPEPITRINILWQPILLKPEEYPGRHGNLLHSAVLVRSTKTSAWHLSLPNPSAKLDTVADALGHLNVTPAYWKNSGVKAHAFGVLAYHASPPSTAGGATTVNKLSSTGGSVAAKA